MCNEGILLLWMLSDEYQRNFSLLCQIMETCTLIDYIIAYVYIFNLTLLSK